MQVVNGHLRIPEPLEHVQVAPVLRNERARVRPLDVQVRHVCPLLVIHVELLARIHNHTGSIVATDDVDELIQEVIMSSEGCPTVSDVGHLFNSVAGQVEDKGVFDRLLDFDVLARYNEHFVVRNVQHAAKLQRLVQALSHHVVIIFGYNVLPFLIRLLSIVDILNHLRQLLVHEAATRILKQFILLHSVRRRPYTAGRHVVRDDVVVEFAGQQLQP